MPRRKLENRSFDFDFRTFADIVVGIIFALQGIMLGFSIASLALAPTLPKESSSAIDPCLMMTFTECFIIMLYFVDRIRYPDTRDNVWRCLMTFSALAGISVVNILFFLERFPAGSNVLSLEKDFQGLSSPLAAVIVVYIASGLSTIFAFLGLWGAHYEQRPIGKPSVTEIPEPNMVSNTHAGPSTLPSYNETPRHHTFGGPGWEVVIRR